MIEAGHTEIMGHIMSSPRSSASPRGLTSWVVVKLDSPFAIVSVSTRPGSNQMHASSEHPPQASEAVVTMSRTRSGSYWMFACSLVPCTRLAARAEEAAASPGRYCPGPSPWYTAVDQRVT